MKRDGYEILFDGIQRCVDCQRARGLCEGSCPVCFPKSPQKSPQVKISDA